jgi:tetratricopeptide (TPR) repeat protein
MAGIFNRSKPKRIEPTLASKANTTPVKATDAYGREVEVPREEWRTRVLPDQVRQHWNDPNMLYRVITSACEDGFADEVEEASRQLLQIDPIMERSHITRAIVLHQLNNLALAESLLHRAIAQSGATGALLTNLAKLIAAQDRLPGAHETLWRSLELDPNQDYAIGWWVAIHEEKSGKASGQEALEKIASLPGSWRAQLWMARTMLDSAALQDAIAIYESVLRVAPLDSDALTVISSDLGSRGHSRAVADLIAPRYRPSLADARTGLNLATAYCELQDFAAGLPLMDQLYALGNPGLSNALRSLSERLEALQREQTPPVVHESAPEVQVVLLDRPLWLIGAHDPTWATSAKTAGRKIAFLALTVATPRDSSDPDHEKVVSGREDTIGRTSRAIPLFLAETLYFESDLSPLVLIPTATNGGLVLFGAPETEDHLAHLLQSYDLVVTGTVSAHDNKQSIQLQVRSATQPGVIAEIKTEFLIEDAGNATLALSKEFLSLLSNKKVAQACKAPGFYEPPPPSYADQYLTALGQVLVITLTRSPEQRSLIWGERSIFTWLQTLAITLPDHEASQFLFFTSLVKAKRYGSRLLPEFERVAMTRLHDLMRAQKYSARLAPLLYALYGRFDDFEWAAAGQHLLEPGYAAWCDVLANELLSLHPKPALAG